MRGEAQKPLARVDFVMPQLLWRILAPNRLAILPAMTTSGPLPIRQTAASGTQRQRGALRCALHFNLGSSIAFNRDFPFPSLQSSSTLPSELLPDASVPRTFTAPKVRFFETRRLILARKNVNLGLKGGRIRNVALKSRLFSEQ